MAETQKYFLNVDPGVEHELTDTEVIDLASFGFEVKKVGDPQVKTTKSAPAEKEKS